MKSQARVFLAVLAAALATAGIALPQGTGQRKVGWANTVTELLSLTPSKDAYVYITKGNLYSSNLDGRILAYDPSSTATVDNTNVWAPDSGIGRWLLISTLNGSGGGGGGAITLAMPDGFSVAGSPLTPPGTLTVSSSLTNMIKGTGSGFSNGVAAVDYVAPGVITGSGLTMTGTNLLGRYSTGTGAIQQISVSNGISFYASQLLGPLNATDTRIPYHVAGSDFFGDSPWSVTSTNLLYISTNTVARILEDGSIIIGTDAYSYFAGEITDPLQGYGLMSYRNTANGDSGENGAFFNTIDGDFASTANALSYGTSAGVAARAWYPSNGYVGGYFASTVRPTSQSIRLSQNTSNSVFLTPSTNGFSVASPFFLQAWGTNGGSNPLLLVQYLSTNAFRINHNSGYTGAGTNALSDDGTFKSITALGAATVNPTSGYLPYNNAGTFADSPWYRISTNTVGFNGTSSFLSTTNDNLFLNSTPKGTGTNNVAIRGSANISAALNSLSSGNDNIAIGAGTLAGISTQSGNIAIGTSAGPTVNNSQTTSIGYSAGQFSGTQATAIGHSSNAQGSGDTAIGHSAKTGTGGSNITIGQNAGVWSSSGSANTLIGTASAYESTTASYNTHIGAYSGQSNVIGSYNIMIGRMAGNIQTNSESNTFIGESTGVASAQNITNSVAIGRLVSPVASNTAQIGTNGVFVLYLNGDVGWFRGTGAPTSHSSALVTNAPVGSMYSRLDGGAGSSFYVVETSSGNWQAK